jgi:signal transduction histidine kinase
MAFLRRIAARFLAADVVANPSSIEYQRSFFLFLALGIIFTASSASILGYWWLGETRMILVSASICLICVISAAVWYWKKNSRWAVSLIILGLIGITVFAMTITGGIVSIMVINFFTPTVLGLLFFSRRVMMQIFALSVAIMLVFIIIDVSGNTPPPIFRLESNGLIFGGIVLALLFGMVGTFYISDAIRQEAYQELQHERDTVQQRIQEATQHLAERNTALEQATRIAETVQRLQADFLRNISHEVRTPLSIILGFTEIVGNEVPSEQTHLHLYVGQISAAAHNLLDIFNNGQTLFALQSSEMQPLESVVHIASVLKQVLSDVQVLAEQKNLALQTDYATESVEWAVLDGEYLRKILRQLLLNAIKFTEQGSVTLSYAGLPRQVHQHPSPDSAPALLRFSVLDTGVGIAPEVLGSIFTAFYQHDASKTRQFGGLGLGLAVVKKLVEAMNGRVWCESELGKGARFIVELPCAKPSEAQDFSA